MKNKILIAIALAIFVLLPVPVYAQQNIIEGVADSIGYAVDSVIDGVRLFLTFDAKAKADLSLEIADKKVNQITELSKKGNLNLAETVKSDYKRTVDEIKNAVIKDEAIKSKLTEDIIEHKAKAASAKISLETKISSSSALEEVDAKASELASIAKIGNQSSVSKEKVGELIEELKSNLSEFIRQAQQNQSQFQIVTQQYLQYVGLLFTQVYVHWGVAEYEFNQSNYSNAYEEALIAKNLLSEVKELIKQAKDKEQELATKPVILVQPPNIDYYDDMKAAVNITNIGGKPLIINDISCKVCTVDFTKGTTLNQGESVIVFVKFTEKVGSNYATPYDFLKISSNDRDVKIPVYYAIREGEGISNVTPVSYDDYDISKLPYDASNYDEAAAYWSQFPNVTFECRNPRGEFINKIENQALCSVYGTNITGEGWISYEVREGDIKKQKLIKECARNKFTAAFYNTEDGIRVTFNYTSGSANVTSSGIGLVSISHGWSSPSFKDKVTLLPGSSKDFYFADYDKYTPIRDFNFLAVCGNPDSIFGYDTVNIIVKCLFTGNFGETVSCSTEVHKVTPTSEIPSTPSPSETAAGSARPNKTAEDISVALPVPSPSGGTAGSSGRTKTDEDILREKEQRKELIAKSDCTGTSFNAAFEKYNKQLPWGEIVNALNVTLSYASGKSSLSNTYMMLQYGTTTQSSETADKNLVFKQGDSQTFQFSGFSEPFYTQFYGTCERNFVVSVTCAPSAEKIGGVENCLSEVE
ncbi:MAG: hypothetical protein HYT72_04805 [Candidatus Aenigmarchaeota archaeon]|nr:hypothetical protein [Candidatus Aenigmarchaeota archaeon]